MSKKRRIYNPEFKAQVVMELMSGSHTMNELADKYHIAPATLSSWQAIFMERASELFKKGTSDTENQMVEKDAKIETLEKKVGQLTIEVDWLKKKSDEIFGPQGTHRTRFPRNGGH